MKFHLDYKPPVSSFKIDHTRKIFLTGSCFSGNIGGKLRDFKFSVLSNPGGILFNPSSIATALQNIILQNSDEEKFVLERDSIYYSYLHHSSCNDRDRDALLNKIKAINSSAHQFLKSADVLIITFGTAFVYRHKELNKTVANCHKQPQNVFEKNMLSVEQIVRNYSTLIQHLQLFNPALKVVFTVSPVKYLRDGVEENSLSKSVLLLSVNELVKKFSNCFYFPAYELITDDLRDYRFYKEDLAHPNQQAIDYVWNKFSDCYFDAPTNRLNDKIQRLNLALAHKDLNSSETELKKLKEFIAKQQKIIKDLYPGFTF